MIWHDNGHGCTADSLVYFQRHRCDIGEILGVKALEYYTERDGWTKYSLQIAGNRGEIWLSGCTVGCGGEGPYGTAKVLGALGYTEEYRRYAFSRSSFELGPPDKPEIDRPPPPPEDWELNDRALDVLEAIQDLYAERGRIPSVTRISRRAGFRTSSGAQWQIVRLEKAGKVRRVKGRGVVWFEGMPEDE